MEFQDKPDELEEIQEIAEKLFPPPAPEAPQIESLWKAPATFDTLKRFFQVTGGSSLYCLSAVFIAYGIVKLLKPILVGSDTISDAIPCLVTLHAYELALLGVLLLIVFKKVVDDAISLTVLIALFMIGSSIALGSVADRGLTASYFLGLAGLIIGVGKIYAMRRFAGIQFGLLSLVGLSIVIGCNYWGPSLMARSIVVNPGVESGRRTLWLLIYLVMLAGATVVLIEAVRRRIPSIEDKKIATPFLQSPAMAYIFALIILAATGVHQYWMAYAFALERVLMDYVPVMVVGSLLLIEILRLANKRHKVSDILIACVPLAMVLLSIKEKSVLSSGQFGLGWLCYPPVIFTITGLVLAALAKYHHWKHLWIAVYFYALGVLLTLGFTPQYPYQLSYIACIGTLIATMSLYGLVYKNPYMCLGSIALLCICLANYDPFLNGIKGSGLTEPGVFAGIGGSGILLVCLIFVKQLHRFVRLVGASGVAIFIFDYLPASMHSEYLLVLLLGALLIGVLWLRTRDIAAITIICLPGLIRLYMMTQSLASWRYIIVGFLVLIAGAAVSLFKKPAPAEEIADNETET